MSDVIEDSVTKDKKLTAKNTSHISQIVSALWIAGWSAFAFITGNPVGITDIVFSGLAIACSFTPVYFNIILDKIKDIKLGNK